MCPKARSHTFRRRRIAMAPVPTAAADVPRAAGIVPRIAAVPKTIPHVAAPVTAAISRRMAIGYLRLAV